ncbi:3-oxoacyl-[acyl-carrier-protein] reductase [Novacetimonas hansenii]|uniref:3-oxoacyl-[acyl-carrier-protein] reductase n=2 Tax=Novacetimonas hansenii TaxID=436 RepID=A0AAW5EP11_NOVHA|nr:3-oxoacyl-[acyl-carrier-protein] reductase [Novacetimonas hansenii]EFG84912.1 3-oxoacyl-[acyl-carrier-protein] reductase [Novacetimonas hansenii ATCC 23769]MBL7235719.1 3-oxoacyl-[acyl-carrier-protein] reductase [Novacetimonas hansenii]MCJ8352526.1 3-oxoacyl-[acyl-carrier-protein] reductase [Novacetimonas hansenii]PYD71512.1 3-oxoacyl-[acyl-carrier-protein] reductase [Novacetimonas hansenii]QOF94528.1 3-oxoacyl-[acyl-carrier-protein] reductase [Novacetimonas hansenii]
MFRLDGKVALVTGASGGIGSAIARALHGQGACVVLSGTREQVLRDVAASIARDAGTDEGRLHVCTADLSDAAAADVLVATAEEKAGAPLDILVNNAGLTRDTLAIRMKDEDWSRVMDVDLSAPFRLSRATLKGMLRRRSGRIVNIASVVGVTGNAGQVNYSAAKAGMIGMSKSMAQEAGARGVTVNVVAPGFIQTAMTDVLPDAQKEKLVSAIPLGRMGQPDDVASAVVYLVSPQAAWVTGATLHVNGGMAMS